MNFAANSRPKMQVISLRQSTDAETAHFNTLLNKGNRNAVIMLQVAKITGILLAIGGIYMLSQSRGYSDEIGGSIVIFLIGASLALLGFKGKAAGSGLARPDSYPIYSASGYYTTEIVGIGKYRTTVHKIGGIAVVKPFEWLMGSAEGDPITAEVLDFHGDLHLLTTPAGHRLSHDIDAGLTTLNQNYWAALILGAITVSMVALLEENKSRGFELFVAILMLISAPFCVEAAIRWVKNKQVKEKAKQVQ